MTFQWDILLLETGFISIFFAPLWYTELYESSPATSLARELLRYLSFRLMVSSGLVKLLSRCTTWWSLTALHYHFETQPIPYYLSWYAHNLTPDVVKRYGVAITLFSEIVLPFLFYSPFREHRVFSSLCNMLLMLIIALTGNYNFFNFLTVLLLMTVLDDQFVFKYIPKRLLQILDIKVPLECIVVEMKEEAGDTHWCWLILSKARVWLAYSTLVSTQ